MNNPKSNDITTHQNATMAKKGFLLSAYVDNNMSLLPFPKKNKTKDWALVQNTAIDIQGVEVRLG